jgi:hypothetical protein
MSLAVRDGGRAVRPRTFDYDVVYQMGRGSPLTSLIVSWLETDRPLRAVLWSVPRQRWISAPEIAVTLLYDDTEEKGVGPVDRATAERIAREYLGTELPTEEQLHRICEEGARKSEK